VDRSSIRAGPTQSCTRPGHQNLMIQIRAVAGHAALLGRRSASEAPPPERHASVTRAERVKIWDFVISTRATVLAPGHVQPGDRPDHLHPRCSAAAALQAEEAPAALRGVGGGLARCASASSLHVSS
jgi:hypothetical protein